MPSLFTEDTYEQAVIELFENMGYDHLYAPEMERDYTSPLQWSPVGADGAEKSGKR